MVAIVNLNDAANGLAGKQIARMAGGKSVIYKVFDCGRFRNSTVAEYRGVGQACGRGERSPRRTAAGVRAG